jgi:GntP family gluconate:H+ symporter
VILTAAASTPSNPVLVTAALLGIATVVILITWLKVHPFLALILGSGVLGLVARLGAAKTITSFEAGVGATVGSVGILIALGAIIGGLLADSGGAATLVETTVNRVSPRALPWAMAGVAALVGIPLFFEVGVVLLVPIVLLVAQRTKVPLLRIGIPALAGLSVLHGFIPPHPGPLAAISVLKADLGVTLGLGLLVAIPAVILAGPVYGTFISRYVTARPRGALFSGVAASDPASQTATDLGQPGVAVGGRGGTDGGSGTTATATAPEVRGEQPRRPGVVPTVVTVLLPVVLMLARAIGQLTLNKSSHVRSVLDVIGDPVVALLAGAIFGMFALGVATGMTRDRISASVGASFGPIAGILLIVAAGGGFKQTLVDAGVGNVIADWAKGAHISALILGWLVAVGIRVATGSATVATITAAGIVSPLAAGMDKPGLALLVLAIGAGSLFFSHVNDAGFWLVKEYFGMSVGETIASWSVMETIISVVGIMCVLLLNLVV